MAEVRETQLPGVGVRHEFVTESGLLVGVIAHRDGRREVLVYDQADPDACSSIIELSAEDTRTMAELLGTSQVTEAVAAVQQRIEGLTIEWLHVTAGSGAAGATIREGEYRTRTGASIVAVIRSGETVPAPDPEQRLQAGDVVVAVGTADGLTELRRLLTR